MSNSEYFMAVMMAVTAFATVFLFGLVCGVEDMRTEAIKRWHAEYSQETGKWQWKEPAVKEGDEAK